ncbi:MAG: helix-turn-helix domain-containing protein [Pseudomonadota bacterium]
MARTSLKHLPCSIAQFAEAMGDKWSFMIVRDAMTGVTTFSGFERSLGIAKNVLTDRLNHLIENDILARRQPKADVERYEYVLTQRGIALLPVAAAIIEWSNDWIFGPGREPFKLVERSTGAPVQSIAILSREGKYLRPHDVMFADGPGARKPVQSKKP